MKNLVIEVSEKTYLTIALIGGAVILASVVYALTVGDINQFNYLGY